MGRTKPWAMLMATLVLHSFLTGCGGYAEDTEDGTLEGMSLEDSVANLPTVSSAVFPQIASSALISHLYVTIKTGGDDLRAGSVAWGVLTLRDHTHLDFQLNANGQGWGNNSTHTARINLPPNIHARDLYRFTLKLDGAPRRWPDSYDNWNVDSLRVYTPPVCTGGNILAAVSGHPFVRFTGNREVRTIPFSVPSQLQNARPTSIQVSIRTGGDDLRSGAIAYGTLNLPGRRHLPAQNLNHGKPWGNNSTHTVTMSLYGQRLGDILSLTLTHDGAPRNVFEGYDNWNVDSVRAYLPRTCASHTFISRAGHPLVRLTGSVNSRTYPF